MSEVVWKGLLDRGRAIITKHREGVYRVLH